MRGVRAIAVIKPVVLIATFVPAAMLAAVAFSGASPVAFFPRYVVNNTGDWALRFLVLSLCVTPLRRLTAWHDVIRLRRTLGVAAFAYSAVHLVAWAALEWLFQFRAMFARLLDDPFISVGAAAFVLLVPLAATSTRGTMAALGRRWRTLHRLTYAALAATLAHFWLEGPAGAFEVRKWIAIGAALTAFRVVVWRRDARRSLRSATV